MGRTVTYAIAFTKSSPFSHEIKQQKTQRKAFLQDGNVHAAAKTSLEIADLLIAQCDEIDPDMSPEQQEKEIESYLLEAFQYCEKARKPLTLAKDTMGLSKHDPDESKFTDFDHARLYYFKERTVLDTLTSDDYDKDGKILADLIRSNNFNLGVIETKFPDTEQKAEEYLITALRQAKTLCDPENEKKTWWELGNALRKRGILDRVLQCQEKELLLIRRHGFDTDEIPCLVEHVKTHLELGNYKKCFEGCKEIKDIEDTDGDGVGSATLDLVNRTQALLNEIAKLSPGLDELTIIGRARLHLELGKLKSQMHYGAAMIRSALTWANTALADMRGREDINVELQMLRIDLMQLKANCQWDLRETPVPELVELNNDILSCIRTYVADARDRVDLLRLVYERFIRIYNYYEQPDESERWRQVMIDTEKEYEALEATDDSTTDELEYNGDLSLKDHKTASAASRAFMTVRVNVPLENKEEIMLIPCRKGRATVEWLMEETAKRAWDNYGTEPNITFMRLKEATLYPDDLIADVIHDTDSTISAVVNGFKRKMLSDHYENICKRMKIPMNQSVVESLKSQGQNILSLRTAALFYDRVLILHELLTHAQFLTHLDLSRSLLCDEDLDAILNGTKLPPHINLSDNRLTAKTLEKLCQQCLSGIESLSLAFNPLGPSILECMTIIAKGSNLKNLDLEGSQVGNIFEVEEILQKFDQCEDSKLANPSKTRT
ncbi:hypothetical protein EC973_006853 [Apophysomyces ossiformis]|uniref:Uncharacterized protein n=1 Tax=Apophysomyces ossiformis TaxID=679940 RepID=A0A8H7BQJ7_9FUNG|nr:hypothetical protein EC973_006853 [Apophysomyces ossiformis]